MDESLSFDKSIKKIQKRSKINIYQNTIIYSRNIIIDVIIEHSSVVNRACSQLNRHNMLPLPVIENVGNRSTKIRKKKKHLALWLNMSLK